MRAMAAKSDVWLTTQKQPALCDQLAMEMNNNALISDKDRVSRLKRMYAQARQAISWRCHRAWVRPFLTLH